MPKQAMFNARIETVETSAAFKDAFASTRCLIPADGFFEWTRSPVAGATPLAHLPAGVPPCMWSGGPERQDTEKKGSTAVRQTIMEQPIGGHLLSAPKAGFST